MASALGHAAEDEAAARGLIARFENPAVLSDLSASLEATPSSGVSGLAVLAQLVLLRSQKAHRSAGARFMAMWRESVDAQLGPAEAILGDPAAAWTQHAAAVQRIDAILPGRLAGYSQNLVGNYWFGRLFTASDSPLVHAQHLLLLHGVIRLSLVHDPRVVHALDQPAEALSDALSAAVVQVTWQTYRALEHHKLLTVLQQALAEDRSGGVTHSLCTI